ncbi:hypothetical protein BU26DRAFT_597478 [Trematosphaeria pertusa]|uniref:Uncharacterized protein n=1 Tax=Trematosphaeria pertusa TaxID=390896 RepID=A0A6A6IAU2_9PLEO|nr:uncharacterized protein BU26DRAFT_597478 [Trematosphaeria pertusa]KAF2247501.1 hypothetical protein BU26DRAFT_597478 [Trematosphaeria pertusa]
MVGNGGASYAYVISPLVRDPKELSSPRIWGGTLLLPLANWHCGSGPKSVSATHSALISPSLASHSLFSLPPTPSTQKFLPARWLAYESRLSGHWPQSLDERKLGAAGNGKNVSTALSMRQSCRQRPVCVYIVMSTAGGRPYPAYGLWPRARCSSRPRAANTRSFTRSRVRLKPRGASSRPRSGHLSTAWTPLLCSSSPLVGTNSPPVDPALGRGNALTMRRLFCLMSSRHLFPVSACRAAGPSSTKPSTMPTGLGRDYCLRSHPVEVATSQIQGYPIGNSRRQMLRPTRSQATPRSAGELGIGGNSFARASTALNEANNRALLLVAAELIPSTYLDHRTEPLDEIIAYEATPLRWLPLLPERHWVSLLVGLKETDKAITVHQHSDNDRSGATSTLPSSSVSGSRQPLSRSLGSFLQVVLDLSSRAASWYGRVVRSHR